MKTILVFSVCFIASLSQAQTAIIAHKSHSGTAADFFIDPSTNFGDPGPSLIQIVRLNDSTYVHVMSEFSGYIYHDTMRYNRKEGKLLDSIYEREKYIELINFRNSPDSLKVKPPTKPNYNELQVKPQQEVVPRKKKKRSAILFIFLVTGGGLLAFRFFSRIFTPQVTL